MTNSPHPSRFEDQPLAFATDPRADGGRRAPEAARVAHDANNLMQVAQANLNQLAELGLGAEARELLADAHESVARASALLRTLTAPPVAAPLSLVAIDGLVAGLRPLMAKLLPRDVSIELMLRSGSHVHADKSHLERIIMNLVINARDAMPAGGRLTLSTKTRPGSPTGVVELLVADTGSGMTSSILDRAFDPYFTTKSRQMGAGLGLDIVRQLVHEMGGTIHVESRAGEGTEVGLRFPIARLAPR